MWKAFTWHGHFMKIELFGILEFCCVVRFLNIDRTWQLLWFLPEASFGLWVLSLPAYVCVCVSVNHELVPAIIHQPFKLESPNLDQGCKRPWLRALLFSGAIDPDLQDQIKPYSKNLPHVEHVRLSVRLVTTNWSQYFQIWTKNAS